MLRPCKLAHLIWLPLMAAMPPGAVAQTGAASTDGGEIVIGVAAPLQGASEILGRQITTGAAEAVSAGTDRLVEGDTACSAEGGEAAARLFVERQVSAVVGFLCTASLEAALPILSEAAIPTIDVGVRADRILKRRDKDGALLWRIAPGSTAEADAVARFVGERWRGESFAIVEDGSAYGRDMADSVREILERDGVRPALIDNYRPAEGKQFALARRIEQSGVTHVLVFGTRSDIAVVARDAKEVGLDISIAGGESLIDEGGSETALAEGVMAIASGYDVDWTPGETPPPDEGYATIARIGAEIAVQAVRRARGSGRSLAEVLNTETFVTAGGLVRFETTGSADIVPFKVYRWDGKRFATEGEG